MRTCLTLIAITLSLNAFAQQEKASQRKQEAQKQSSQPPPLRREHATKSLDSFAATSSRPPFEPVAWKEGLPPSTYTENTPSKIYQYLVDAQRATGFVVDEFTSPAEKEASRLALKERVSRFTRIAIPYKCHSTYEAELQRFRVFVSISNFAGRTFPKNGLNAEQEWILKSQLEVLKKNETKYVAQNSFGAQTEVSKADVEVYSVAFNRISIDSAHSIFPSQERWFTNKSLFTYGIDSRTGYHYLVGPAIRPPAA